MIFFVWLLIGPLVFLPSAVAFPPVMPVLPAHPPTHRAVQRAVYEKKHHIGLWSDLQLALNPLLAICGPSESYLYALVSCKVQYIFGLCCRWIHVRWTFSNSGQRGSYPKLAATPALNYSATLVYAAEAQPFGGRKGTSGQLGPAASHSLCQRHLPRHWPHRLVSGVKVGDGLGGDGALLLPASPCYICVN